MNVEHKLLFSSGSLCYSGVCFSGIYGIQCHTTSKWYVGESIHVLNRISAYIGLNCNKQKLIYNAIKKYGIGNFSCYKLEECEANKKILGEREIHWGTQLNSMAPNGYNLKLGSSGSTMKNKSQPRLGAKWSEEQKQKYIETRQKNKKRKELELLFVKQHKKEWEQFLKETKI